jgi:hypothetical protein
MGFTHLLFGLISVAMVGGVGYWMVERGEPTMDIRTRSTLLPIIGGLLGYNYIALSLPGSAVLLESLGVVAVMVLSIGMGAIGLLVALILNGIDS